MKLLIKYVKLIKKYQEKLFSYMYIGNVEIDGKVVLAPMAGVADTAFRTIAKDFGAAAVTSEMVSSKGICFGDKKSKELLKTTSYEHPISLQIFGDDPSYMARAAYACLEHSPDIIDINMGCPAPKISGNGSGSALMKSPNLCGEIVKAVVSAVNVPVTVKIRKGYDKNSVNAVEIAKICEDNGAAAICVHARTRDQMYSPPIDLNIIKAVKEAVNVPVIGNGDINSPSAASAMFEKTNCDLIMIGRAALGAPWIFSQINAFLNHERYLPDPEISKKMLVMFKHIKLACELKGEIIAMKEARKHVAWYVRGLIGAPGFRKEAGTLSTLNDLEQLVVKILDTNNGFSKISYA